MEEISLHITQITNRVAGLEARPPHSEPTHTTPPHPTLATPTEAATQQLLKLEASINTSLQSLECRILALEKILNTNNDDHENSRPNNPLENPPNSTSDQASAPLTHPSRPPGTMKGGKWLTDAAPHDPGLYKDTQGAAAAIHLDKGKGNSNTTLLLTPREYHHHPTCLYKSHETTTPGPDIPLATPLPSLTTLSLPQAAPKRKPTGTNTSSFLTDHSGRG
ncbi:hypothetical protein Pcinc_021424 [Petrolisthes cinctipes]|uniref:Uncharacterized protein n=1 Tax=Petrolisthes cinctipes TaxID=88211 RepID=A0AAE1FHF6_PETCI|nr:hypothetical protein Pcinc_021424 [Petrolisthes cinctipes]